MTIDKFIAITEIKTQLALLVMRYRIYRSQYSRGNLPMQSFLELEDNYIEASKFARFQVNAQMLKEKYAYY